MLRGKCSVFGSTECKFVSLKEAQGGDSVISLNAATSEIKLPWAKFPGELHLPGMNFAGPGTNLDKRLTTSGACHEWSKPSDRIDEVAYIHDLNYQHFPYTEHRNIADRLMLEQMDGIKNHSIEERIERAIMKPILNTKQKFGLCVSKNCERLVKKKKRVKWSDQLTEELHKPLIENFRKRRVYVESVNKILAADLVDMQAFAKFNDGFKDLLTVIDIFSKYA